MFALTHGRIYTGHDVLDDHAVIIADGLIERVCPAAELPAGIETRDWVAPSRPRAYRRAAERLRRRPVQRFAGSDFGKTLEIMQRANEKSGCTSYLPTLITSSDEFMKHSVDVMRAYLKSTKTGRWACTEGPYLSPVKRHP